MVCTRCRGLMVRQAIWECESRAVSRGWPPPPFLWRCLICGERVDSTIVLNRKGQAGLNEHRKFDQLWDKIRAASTRQFLR